MLQENWNNLKDIQNQTRQIVDFSTPQSRLVDTTAYHQSVFALYEVYKHSDPVYALAMRALAREAMALGYEYADSAVTVREHPENKRLYATLDSENKKVTITYNYNSETHEIELLLYKVLGRIEIFSGVHIGESFNCFTNTNVQPHCFFKEQDAFDRQLKWHIPEFLELISEYGRDIPSIIETTNPPRLDMALFYLLVKAGIAPGIRNDGKFKKLTDIFLKSTDLSLELIRELAFMFQSSAESSAESTATHRRLNKMIEFQKRTLLIDLPSKNGSTIVDVLPFLSAVSEKSISYKLAQYKPSTSLGLFGGLFTKPLRIYHVQDPTEKTRLYKEAALLLQQLIREVSFYYLDDNKTSWGDSKITVFVSIIFMKITIGIDFRSSRPLKDASDAILAVFGSKITDAYQYIAAKINEVLASEGVNNSEPDYSESGLRGKFMHEVRKRLSQHGEPPPQQSAQELKDQNFALWQALDTLIEDKKVPSAVRSPALTSSSSSS